MFCPDCNSIVETNIIHQYSFDISQTYEYVFQGTRSILSSCINCERPFLFKQDYHDIEGEFNGHELIQLYPDKDSEFIPNAPKTVLRSYKESQKCFQANAYDACVVMCRKGIEAICIDKGEKKGNLITKLKNLKDKGILENTFYDWSNKLREVGNYGAHSHEHEISKQEAKDTLDFFEVLITYLYHLVDKYNKFSERLENNARP